MQSSVMKFEFGDIHYQHLISGKKQTILFLHSFHSSTVSFRQVCELLKDKFNLVCMDFPGHGLSAHLDVEKYSWYYSVDGLTNVVLEFIHRLNLDNLFIVGNSLGGNVGVRTIPNIKVLKGLIILASFQAERVEELFALHRKDAPLDILFQKEITAKEIELIAATYVNKPKNYEQMVYDISHTDVNCRGKFGEQLKTQPWVNELQILQKSNLPLMYILGLEDGFVDSINYKNHLLASGLKDSQINILEHVGHVPHLDNPELCVKLILEFINNATN